MFTADTHCDTLWELKKGTQVDKLMASPDKLRAGNVGIQTFALFTGSKGPAGTPYDDAVKMLEQVDKLGIPFIYGKLPDEPPCTTHGIISIEGGEALEGKLERLTEFYEKYGIRMIALTWNWENEIGHPAKNGPKPGLKPFGLELLKKMDEYGIYADVSHLNEAGFWDVYENMKLPPIASHSNNRELCDVPRNLYKAQIEAIIKKNGYIGINFYNRFLTDNGKADIDDVIRHIDSIADLGGIDVLGFGSDFDGIELWPDGLSGSDCFPRLIEALLKHGYTDEQVEKMAGLNLWKLLKAADDLRNYAI